MKINNFFNLKYLELLLENYVIRKKKKFFQKYLNLLG
jgi:hypothetical protein